jgi:hypothetical protein
VASRLSTACAHRLWTLWTPDRVVGTRAAQPVDDAPAGSTRDRTLPGMSIEIRALEVHALAATLRDTAGEADLIGVRLAGARSVGGALQPAVEAFLECHRTAGLALAGELRWLGSTVAGVADSWVRLDGALVRPAGRMRAE